MSNYDNLVAWATANGAYLNPNVSISVSPETGALFVATADLPESAPITSCPMSLSLSYLNLLGGTDLPFADPYAASNNSKCEGSVGGRPAVVRNIPFPADFLAATPPHVLSRFLLMQQYLAGETSPWSVYISALPQPGKLSLPVLWDSDDIELLDGTNLGASATEIQTRLGAEYAAARERLTGWTDGGWREFSRDLYYWAYGIFTSRSFTPRLVLPAGVCRRLESRLQGCSLEDFSLLLPLYDIGNHDMTAPATWATDDGADAEAGGEGPSRVTLTVARAHAKGEQVFNNYGMRTNSQLLLSYGFMIPESEAVHNDYVHLKRRDQQPGVAHDYLLSLYPAGDRRSVVLEHRQIVKRVDLAALSDGGKNAVLSSFLRVQDEIVYDLVLMHTTLDELCSKLGVGGSNSLSEGAAGSTAGSTMGRDVQTAKQAVLGKLLTNQVPDDVRAWLMQAMAVIGAQASVALEKLEETEVEVDEDQIPHLTDNQRLGLGYRHACRRVLEGVLEGIDMGPVDS
ncbi:hypothetical protein BROUX41_003290 [Berkeleyomyces rouxiae]|uniref:uncharacterized protein n=1 Tax=Berkeleyomyces rouxiae TaxID=2035830 RepID=UPI003B7A806C